MAADESRTDMIPSIRYSLAVIRDEARRLVQQRIISRHQAIYTLFQYIPAREWIYIEHELEENDFLLRDCIGDLISYENWSND
jgi:hypothetical protein